MRRVTAVMLGTVCVVTVLSACANAGDSASATDPACSAEVITAVAEESWSGNPAQANEVLGVTCSGEWALATINFIDTDPTDVAANGGEAPVTEGTLLFHFDGKAWGPNAGNDVCGTADMSTDPPAYPDDAQVPEDLWRQACWAG